MEYKMYKNLLKQQVHGIVTTRNEEQERSWFAHGAKLYAPQMLRDKSQDSTAE